MDISKRYLLFMGSNYYPRGGMEDFVLSSDSIPTLLKKEADYGCYLSFDVLQSNKLVYFDHPKRDWPDWGWHYKDKIDLNDKFKSKIEFAEWYMVYDAADPSNLVEVEPRIINITNEQVRELEVKYLYKLEQ